MAGGQLETLYIEYALILLDGVLRWPDKDNFLRLRGLSSYVTHIITSMPTGQYADPLLEVFIFLRHDMVAEASQVESLADPGLLPSWPTA